MAWPSLTQALAWRFLSHANAPLTGFPPHTHAILLAAAVCRNSPINSRGILYIILLRRPFIYFAQRCTAYKAKMPPSPSNKPNLSVFCAINNLLMPAEGQGCDAVKTFSRVLRRGDEGINACPLPVGRCIECSKPCPERGAR